MTRTSPLARRRRSASVAALAVAGLVLAGCGSSAGSDDAASTTEAAVTTTAPVTSTTEAVTTTAVTTTTAAVTTTTAVPSDLTPEQTAVAFVRAIVEGQSADAYVKDPAVASDAERQLGEMGQAAYDSIALDPATSQQEAGAPDACAVNDVTLSCYVLIDRSSSDSEGVNTLVKVGVAVTDLSGVTGPEDPGPKVPAYVISAEIVPS
jgi:outer membrane murein-binding lipoprotein Lpp